MKDKSIDQVDRYGRYHGYQEWYSNRRMVYWYRGRMFHGNDIGYVEQNMGAHSVNVGELGTEVLYYII
jgi:hypothetical protein